MTHNASGPHPSWVRANGIEIAYESFGEPSAAPLLLIQGLGMQMIAWDDGFCRALTTHGFRVIRFDNRDAGLSARFDQAGVPDIAALTQARAQGEALQTPYTLDDMAQDTLGLMDVLRIDSAHVVGISMGGMIAQILAIQAPERVRTLTSIMSAMGEGGAPVPKPEAFWILTTPTPTERAAYLEHTLRVWRTLNGPEMPFDDDQVLAAGGKVFERGLNPAGTVRQMAAIIAAGSRRQALSTLSVPALIIHGTADPLIPIEYGRACAGAIPGARLLTVEGLGHRLHPAALPQIVEAIAQHAHG